MTTEDRLAAIEACVEDNWVATAEQARWLIAEVRRLESLARIGQVTLDMVGTHCDSDELEEIDKSDLSINGWLRMRAARDEALAEVERLKAACAKGKAIIHDIADGSEYARGREDERAAVVAWLSSPSSECRCRDYDAIERGEHVSKESTNGKDV